MARAGGSHRRALCGPSTGANLAVALDLAERLGPEGRVATINVDSGLKYLVRGLEARLGARDRENTGSLERGADHAPLLVRGLDQREPQAADVVAEHGERGLHGDGVRRHRERLDHRTQLCVNRARTLDVAVLEPRDEPARAPTTWV